MTHETFTTAQGRELAYQLVDGAGPMIVVLHGFKSDMEGTKALALEDWAQQKGRALLRFDMSGHGQSSGAFQDGTIGAWAKDAQEIITGLARAPVILVGSSMGGWISLLLARRIPAQIAGLVTIAAAPDFTKEPAFSAPSPADQEALAQNGFFNMPNPYGDPYPITKRLIEDGAEQSIFDHPITLDMPVRFLQGTNDASVSTQTAQRLLDHSTGADIRLTIVKEADHSFSTPHCIELITQAIEEVSG